MTYNRRGERERRNPKVSFQETTPEYHGQSQRYLSSCSISMLRILWIQVLGSSYVLLSLGAVL